MKLPQWTRWTVVALAVIAMLVASACCPPPNQAPTITSLTANPESVAPGDSSTITCVASDTDGDTLTYTWTSTGGTISGTGSIVTWLAPSVEGTYSISVTVDDGRGGTDTDAVAVTVAVIITTGSIDINSNPVGAAVYLDGEDTQNITPYIITNVAEGDHTVKLTYWHYKDRQGMVTVTAGETTYINWALDYIPAQTVTIQPVYPAGNDAYVWEWFPDNNQGDSNELSISTDPGERQRTYLQFDLSSISGSAVVTSAELGLYYSWGDKWHPSAVAESIGSYRVTGSWTEGGITWNNQPPCAATPEDTTTVPVEATLDFIYWDIDDLVQGWIDGSITNYGVMLRDPDESTYRGGKVFLSSEGAMAGESPKLVIEYYDPAAP